MAADWSELPADLVIEIAENLTSVADQISFANVCNSWQSAASTLKNFFVAPPSFPYLLLVENTLSFRDSPPEEKLSDELIFSLMVEGTFDLLPFSPPPENSEEKEEELANDLKEFLVLTTNGKGKICKTLLPEVTKKRCGPSHGWLLTLTEDNIDPTLIHPFNRCQIQLPKLDTSTHGFIKKMVLSSNPLLTDDFFVMVIGSKRSVGYCRTGFTSWIEIPCEGNGSVKDISYHNGRMYALVVNIGSSSIFDWLNMSWECEICSCDMGNDSGMLQRHMKLPVEFTECFSIMNCLLYVLGGVDDDKLLVVVRELRRVDIWDAICEDYDYDNYDENGTGGFQVIEINLKDNKLAKVESLGDRSLFLGSNASISVEADGCIIKPNCIYFTQEGGGKDMGVYHLWDGTIERGFKGLSPSLISSPLWVVPSF